jgi:hypothetical protein
MKKLAIGMYQDGGDLVVISRQFDITSEMDGNDEKDAAVEVLTKANKGENLIRVLIVAVVNNAPVVTDDDWTD